MKFLYEIIRFVGQTVYGRNRLFSRLRREINFELAGGEKIEVAVVDDLTSKLSSGCSDEVGEVIRGHVS